MGLRILVGIIIIAVVAIIVTISHNNSKISLTAQEREQIDQTCAGCHDENSHLDDSLHGIHDKVSCISCHNSVHSIHANAECQTCHVGTTGLETGDKAHDTLQWIGIGSVGMLVAALALNFFVASRRLQTKRSRDEGTNT